MMKYADQRGAPKTIIIGSREAESGEYSVKTMATGEQATLTEADL
jgi:histidyl-tRNA synthetase